MQTFSQRFAYTHYSQKYLKYVEIEIEVDKGENKNNDEEYSSEMDIRSNQSSEYENDEVEIIILFQVILFKLLSLKSSVILTY
ncbi:hypothetical protein RclHR1_00130010 [Rhizophagus clarus]|uniref:Uncharacterized protein n=1 Tax=Rhizophagus clarus TaxID=94130 RepID=A0A2Z6QLB5_9GLOM|nr:hypothetical protein RclHR1_00130010 [Rhizophagus clarus]GES76811.1 hypothetical protein GLOIN_2v1777222 [Rhizophagus clarus]